MKSTLQRLEEIKRNGYRLDLGEAINDIFENYKMRNVVYFVLNKSLL